MTTLATGLSVAFPVHLSAMQGRAYMTNDFDAMKVWDGIDSLARDAGITGPAAAPSVSAGAGGVTDVGTHLVRYRYRTSRSLYVSNPSPSATVQVAGGSQILTLTMVASTDPKVDQILIEVTPVNSPSYYLAATVTNTTSGTVNITDVNLVNATSIAATTGDFEHEKPPLAWIAVPHRGRMFVGGATTRTTSVSVTNGSASVTGTGFSTQWAGRLLRVGTDAVAYEIASATSTTITLSIAYGGTTSASASSVVYSKTPNRIWWSQSLYPEGFRATARSRDVLQGRSDELRGMAAYGGDLWVFGRRSSDRLSFTSDPGVAEGQLVQIPGDRGVFCQRCLIECEGQLFAWDRAGIYQVNPGGPSHVSKPVDSLLNELVDFTKSLTFHGVYDPIDRVLMWFFTRTGDTSCKYAVCLERDTGRWFLNKWMQGITASGIVPDGDGQVRVMLGDENGYTWYYGYENSFDGIASTNATIGQITTGSTTTVTQLSNVIQTSPSLAGVIAYYPSTGLSSVISSNTSSSITLSAPLTAAPANLTEVWLGIIPWEYRTKWFVGSGMQFSRKAIYLLVKMHPSSSTGKLRIYVYSDFSTTPMSLTTFADDTAPDGCTVNVAGAYIELDLDGGAGEGYIPVPMPSDWVRAIQVRATNDRPDGDLRILSMEFSEKATRTPDTE